jgi:hypothetical protein
LPPTPTPVSDDPAPDGDDTPVSPETAAGPAETETAAAPAHDPVAEGQPDGPVGRPVFLAETLGDDRTGLDAAVNSIIAEIPHIEDEDKRRFTAITAPLPFVRLLLARPFVAPPSLTEYGPLLLSEGAHAMALYLLLDCDPIRNKAVQFLTACQRHHGDILPAPLADFREFLGAPLTRPLDARVLEPGFKFRDYMKRELWLFYDLWRTNVPVTIYVGDVIKLLPILVREIALLKGFQARDLRLLDPYWYGRMIQLRKPIADVSLESLKGAIAANLKNKKS